MMMSRNLRSWTLAVLAAAFLVACGGGNSDGDAAAPGTARIGTQGGTVTAADGASVVVPSGAFAGEATVVITRDGAGAPALPRVAAPASAVYKITPHGGDFLRHVTVSLPVSQDAVADGAQLVMITAEPGDTTWRVLSAATRLDGVMSAPVMQFSYFQIVSLPKVRMPVLETQIHRMTNASFPGAQQVPAGTEIAGQVPVAAPLLAIPNGYLRGVEAEARLRWEPVYSASSGGTPPRACLPSDYGPAGMRWTGLRDGATWALSTAHQRLWVGQTFVGADAWPRSLQEAIASNPYAPEPFARSLTNTGDASPIAGFGVAHFYGQASPRTGAKVEPVAGDVYYLPPGGNQAEDDHVSWYGQINLTPADNGRVRLDAVVDTDCGFAVQAAPLSFQLNLTGFPGYAGGVTPRPDVWGQTDQLAPIGGWRDLFFDVNQNQLGSGGGFFGEPTQLDPFVWTDFQEVTSISWEFSADGRTWVPRPDLAARAVARPLVRERTGEVLPYIELYVLPLTDLGPEHAGHYRAFACTRWLSKKFNEPMTALVERTSGCGAYGAIKLDVTGVAPTVTRQPQSQTLLVGERATMSVAGDGFAAPSVQWQKRSFADAFLGLPWVNIAGATGASYTTPALTLADQPTYYRALLINASGTVASDVATVSVVEQLAPPVIVGQPGSLNVNVGGTAVFAVTASGAAPFSYQWRRNGVAITGANTSVLTLNNVTALNDGQYTLAVTNRVGTTVSEPAALVVTLGTPASLPPTLANQPASLSVSEGSAANFAVAVTGTGPYTYAWYRAGTPSPIADTPVLAFPSVSAGDAGSYSVRVTNTVGTVLSSAATLTVTPGSSGTPVAPVVVTPPVAVAALPGTPAVFAVAATGTGPLTYQWRVDGIDIPGATSAVLRLPAVSGLNAGQYSVEVRNGVGVAISSAVPLVVIGAPAIVTAPGAKSATEGDTATFEVAATGDMLRYQWTRNAVAIDGATSASYTTPPLTLADSGAVYSVIVYNGAGLVMSSGAVLTVAPLPNPPGMVLFAGDFSSAGSDIGTGTVARFDNPQGLTADASGNLYVASSNGKFVSKIEPSAAVTHLFFAPITATSFFANPALAPDGSLFVGSSSWCGLWRAAPPLTAPTQVAEITLANCPVYGSNGLSVDAQGRVAIADTSRHAIILATQQPDGAWTQTYFAGATDYFGGDANRGSTDATGTAARFSGPTGLAYAANGDLFVADHDNGTIRRITPAGEVSTFAGTAGQQSTLDGTGTAARLDRPYGLAFDPDGNLIVLTLGASTAAPAWVRRITPAGVVTTLFDARAEAQELATDGNAVANARIVKGIAAPGSKRIALSAGNAVLVRTLP